MIKLIEVFTGIILFFVVVVLGVLSTYFMYKDKEDKKNAS